MTNYSDYCTIGKEMRFTTVTTSKGQLTIPKSVRDKLGLKSGIKVDIYPTDNGFIGRLQRRSRILEVLGDLKHLDNGKPLSEIRAKTQEIAAQEIVRKLQTK